MLSSALIEQILERLPSATIGLVGDLFLDRYWEIAPALGEPSVETGLTAHQVTRVRNSPGALGTVMNNLAALGVGRLLPVTAIGDDGEGYELLRALGALSAVDHRFILRSPLISTPTYTKPMMGAVESNRFDRKNRTPTPQAVEERLLNDLQQVWNDCDAVLVLDQVSEADCGVVTRRMRERIAELAAASPGKFVLADSRELIGLFRNVAIKPNRHECEQSGGISELLKACNRTVFCTDGETGIRLATPGGVQSIPGFPVAGPIDICGAGDSCSAGIACAKVAGCSDAEAAAFGNLIASITVQQIGTTGTASPAQARERWRRVTM